MNIIDALQLEKVWIEVELTASLPVCNREKECVFYYSTQAVDEESFKVVKIFYVYVQDRKSKKLKRLAPEDVIPKEILASVTNCVIFPKVFDEEAINLEDEYYESYEKMSAAAEEDSIDEDIIAVCKSLLQKLVPESPLRQVYYYLCDGFLK